MTTGQRIQRARKNAGLSQKQLGEKLGLSASMIGQWENDLRNPKYDTLKRIAAALEVHMSQLLVNFPPELAEVLNHAENRGEKLVISNKTDLYQSIEESIRLTYDPSPQERINLAIIQLNEEGLEVAAERVEELTEIPRYRAETTPQSPPAPQKGKDITPAPDAPETPPEGE